MLKVYKKLLVPFTIAFLGLFMTEMSLAQVKVLDKIVAIVDDGVVLKASLISEYPQLVCRLHNPVQMHLPWIFSRNKY